MKYRYLKSLYDRNVDGTFFGGYVPIPDAMGLLIWIPHTLLLPLTLTVGAGIKTLFDYFTRDLVKAKEQKSAAWKAYDMSPQDLSKLYQGIKSYEAHSNSSVKMLKDLAEIEKSKEDNYKSIEAETKRKMQSAQVADYIRSHQVEGLNINDLKISYIDAIKLDETHEKQYKAELSK